MIWDWPTKLPRPRFDGLWSTGFGSSGWVEELWISPVCTISAKVFPVDDLEEALVRYRREPRRGVKHFVRTFMPEGYCVKCKAKKEIAEAVEELMKNGRKAIKGKCPTCGVVMFKILGGKATPVVAAPPTPSAPTA